MSESDALLAEFSRYLETFSTLGDLLEFGLDQSTKIFKAAQGSLYLPVESAAEKKFQLRLCCGASPLDLEDHVLIHPRAHPSAEVQALRERRIVRMEIVIAGSRWQRVIVPLPAKDDKAPVLGALVLHFSEEVPEDDEIFRQFAKPIAQNIHELLMIEDLRQNRYAKAKQMAKDPSAGSVARLATALAEELGIGQREVEEIRLAALLRDIGEKATCIQAPRSLTARERQEIQRHAKVGARRLKRLGLPKGVISAVEQHHESYDGSGYPKGLARQEIVLSARVLAVAQTFAALTSPRPYRAALPPDQAMSVVQELSGTQLDPAIVASLPFAVIRARCSDFELAEEAEI